MKNLSKLSLGEGNTPLIRLFNLEKQLSWRGELWAKCEYQNPTGSFKDRGSLVEIAQAIKLNKSGVVCASTGNMAASLAAYAARAGLACVVIIPKSTPIGKLKQASICGTKLIKVNGTYDDCVIEAKIFAKEKNLLLCGDYKLRRLGQSILGEELAGSRINFDALIVPVGNGTLGVAICEGFAKFNKFPKFIGVQGQGADPIFRAWQQPSSIIRIIEQPQTVASAMNVGNPLDGELTLSWVNKTNGELYSVSDKEILSAQKILGQTEGIFVETAAAATLAGLLKLKESLINVVLVLTGSGLKEN